MLIGTEALRESISKLRDRLDVAHSRLGANDQNLKINSQYNGEVGGLLSANRNEMERLESKCRDISAGYERLHNKQAIDREAIIMLCHQYAYASTIPDECKPLIDDMTEPM